MDRVGSTIIASTIPRHTNPEERMLALIAAPGMTPTIRVTLAS